MLLFSCTIHVLLFSCTVHVLLSAVLFTCYVQLTFHVLLSAVLFTCYFSAVLFTCYFQLYCSRVTFSCTVHVLLSAVLFTYYFQLYCSHCYFSAILFTCYFPPVCFLSYFGRYFNKYICLQVNSVNKILFEVSVYLGVCFLYTNGDLKTVTCCTRNILLLMKTLLPLQAVDFSIHCLLN